MDPSRLRVVALVVAAAIFMHNLDATLIESSLPQIGASFGRTAVELNVGITAYILATAAFLPLSGWLADRFSARAVFTLAVALFTLASIGCGLALTLTQFVLARVAQGLAGALMTPVGRTIVLRHASGPQILTAVALITWPGLLAPVIAPVLGGTITTYSSWRWNFLLNLPLGIAVCALAWRLIPAAAAHQPRRLDMPGLLYSSLAMFGLLYGLEVFSNGRHGGIAPWAWLAAGGIALWLTVHHLHRVREPLLDLSILRIQTFSLTNAGVAVMFRASISATPFLLPLMLQLAYGLTPLAAGSFIMVYFLGNVAMKPLTSPLLRRYGFRRVLVVNGFARSMQFTSFNTLGFADLTPAQRSTGSTLHSILLQLSIAMGVAFSALILQKSALLAGRESAALADFRIAFLIAGLAGLVAAANYLRLERNAGAAVVS